MTAEWRFRRVAIQRSSDGLFLYLIRELLGPLFFDAALRCGSAAEGTVAVQISEQHRAVRFEFIPDEPESEQEATRALIQSISLIARHP